jgi:hypothetical protein
MWKHDWSTIVGGQRFGFTEKLGGCFGDGTVLWLGPLGGHSSHLSPWECLAILVTVLAAVALGGTWATYRRRRTPV